MKQVTDHQEECLNILQEECAEVIQIASKIKRFGLVGKRLDSGTNLEHMEAEIGDVLAMIDMVVNSGIGLTKDGINKSKANKLEKLSRYMHTWGDASGI